MAKHKLTPTQEQAVAVSIHKSYMWLLRELNQHLAKKYPEPPCAVTIEVRRRLRHLCALSQQRAQELGDLGAALQSVRPNKRVASATSCNDSK